MPPSDFSTKSETTMHIELKPGEGPTSPRLVRSPRTAVRVADRCWSGPRAWSQLLRRSQTLGVSSRALWHLGRRPRMQQPNNRQIRQRTMRFISIVFEDLILYLNAQCWGKLLYFHYHLFCPVLSLTVACLLQCGDQGESGTVLWFPHVNRAETLCHTALSNTQTGSVLAFLSRLEQETGVGGGLGVSC